MARIKLTQGKYALVDDADFEFLSKYKWYISNHGYAMTTTTPHLYMHRLINKTPKGLLTDHINRKTLDNRKSNLRTADKRINSINRNLQSNNTSGYKGVSWDKQHKKWESYIWKNQVKISLGYFDSFKKAVLVRRQAERKYHGI